MSAIAPHQRKSALQGFGCGSTMLSSHGEHLGNSHWLVVASCVLALLDWAVRAALARMAGTALHVEKPYASRQGISAVPGDLSKDPDVGLL
jgi:hypothetical protein